LRGLFTIKSVFVSTLLLFLLSSCSESASTANPGFQEMDRVNGQTETQYYSNFEEPKENSYRVDLYKEPEKSADQQVVKINAEVEGNQSGTIVVKDGSGVGYIYDKKRNKKEVVVVSDKEGELWAVDYEGNSYPVALSDK